MVKIAYDNYQYWYPEDHERYEDLFHQMSELMSRRHGLSREECEWRDAQADEIRKELDLIKSRQVKITDPEITALREMDYKLEQEILRSLKADCQSQQKE